MKKNDLIGYAILLCGITYFISCKKEVRNIYQTPPSDSSLISITNVSPAISNLRFYLNKKFVTLPDSPVSFGKTALVTLIKNPTTYNPDTVTFPYIHIVSGYQQLGFGSSGTDNILSVQNNNFKPGVRYSIFLTDTLVHGQVTSILLKDNIQNLDSTKSQVRFINLSPDAPPLDLWAYPNAGYTGYKIFSQSAYLPNDFKSFINAESFTPIDRGLYYFEATIAGTNNFVMGGFLIIPGKDVVTIFTKGYLSGTGGYAIDVGVIQYLQ